MVLIPIFGVCALIIVLTFGACAPFTSSSSRPFTVVLGDNNGSITQNARSDPRIKASTSVKTRVVAQDKSKKGYSSKDRKALDKLIVASDKP